MGGSYALLAAVRQKELPTRLVVAVILTAAAYFVAPSAWPVVWLALVVVTQTADWRFYRGIRGTPSRAALAVWIGFTCLTSVVYSLLSIYLWVAGDEAGRLLAVLLAAGSLLHVTIHMHHVRRLLIAAAGRMPSCSSVCR